MLWSYSPKILLLASVILGSLATCSADILVVLPVNCPVVAGTDAGQGGGPCATTNGTDHFTASIASGRFQQAMDPSLFSALDVYGAGVVITGIGLRPDITNTVNSATTSLQLTMGLTSKPVEDLGVNMNNNFDSGTSLVVYNNATSHFIMTPVPSGQSTHNFDYFSALTSPFTYHPDIGKALLFDVVTGPTPTNIIFDTVGQVAGDGVGIQSGIGNLGIANAAQKTGGFVLEFRYYVLTPEPGTFVMMGSGLLGAAFLLRRRKQA